MTGNEHAPIDVPADPKRRLWLTATSVAGGAGLITTAVPFIASLAPSERARALGAPVEVELQGLAAGKLETVAWQGKPIFVLRRSQSMLEALGHHDDSLADPKSVQSDQPAYAKNSDRSIKPEILVLIGLCTHLGCIPTFRPTPGSGTLGEEWPGGFFCPCHGSKFDLAGRVFKNVPAPTNLVVPPYHFANDTRLLIGVGSGA